MDKRKAVLYSLESPSEKQIQGFSDYLEKKNNCHYEIEWVKDDNVGHGFKLVASDEIFDWSDRGRFLQIVEALDNKKYFNADTIPLMTEILSDFELQVLPQEIGTVVTVGDGIATIDGLEKAQYGEILLFDSGIRGMVQNLSEDKVGCIIFDDIDSIYSGSQVRRTGRTASMPVGFSFLGRVVDALGSPIDGNENIAVEAYFPIERKAPGIIERHPVNVPLETGLLSIDSMFPIGRGQRELIIGDRQTGKTAIAIDTIINQKGKDCICIYVAIGQKASSVAQIAEKLRKYGAMEYTCIVAANASDADPLQYIAPYAGCALGEYFMSKGKDVLIVYDDLSKHAVAYRSISLLLDRSPGREAYPGDVFYLHSRLLERSAHLNTENGGGSLTALPIVETQGGDVSSYIPTNIISITDGQIYLESGLFFAGQRPAVNVGLSVSRVGGDAQTKAMKKAAGTLRLDLAQYREMEVFTQFSSDLDETTKKQLTYGAGLMQMLRQLQYHPYTLHEQVIMLISALSHSTEDVSIDEITNYNMALLDMFEQDHADICKLIDNSKDLEDSVREEIIEISKDFASNWIEHIKVSEKSING